MKATSAAQQQNVVYTCIPISFQTFQANAQQQNQPVAFIQNITVKKLSNGKYAFVESNPVGQDHSMTFGAAESEIKNESSELKANATGIVITEQESATLKPMVIIENNPPKTENNNVSGNAHVILEKAPRSRAEPEPVKCNFCGQTFDKTSSYRKHLDTHRNVKKYKCQHCFESYNVEDNFKLHMAIHEEGQPSCPMCDRKFQRLASLKSHLQLHQVEETFTCNECLAEFEKEDEYNKHMDGHLNDKLDGIPLPNIPYICSYCNYLFDDPKKYKEHVSYHIKMKKLVLSNKKTRRRNVTNKEYPHKCDICKKSFAKGCLLERHMRMHTGEKPFKCSKCNKAFAQKCTLQIHLSKHSGIKPFKCSLCPAEYFQKGNLRVHVEKTHTAPPDGEKLYKCTQCTCIFRKVASLNGHITKCHGGKRNDQFSILAVQENLIQLQKMSGVQAKPSDPCPDESDVLPEEEFDDGLSPNVSFVKLADSSVDGAVRRYLVKQRRIGDIKWFICSYCSKEFKKPSDLIRHIRVHTREKPFKCLRCGQAFSLKSTLISHMNTHLGRKDFQCLKCSKMFTSTRTLNIHLRKHENAKPVTKMKDSIHFKCSVCSKLFSSVTKAHLHMNIHETLGKTIVLKRNKYLNSNDAPCVMKQPMLETIHGLLPVAPPKPKVPFADMEEYKNRPYKCHICNAAFMKPVHVKRHMLTHSGEKNFICDVCTKTFYTPYALKEHLQFHSNTKNYPCKICGKRFITKILMKRHTLKHSPLRPYICPYCKKRFKTVFLCRKHIKIHRRDIDLQLQALNETGEIDNMESSDTAKIIDLGDVLDEGIFDVSPGINVEVGARTGSQLTDGSENVSLNKENELGSKNIRFVPRISRPKKRRLASNLEVKAEGGTATDGNLKEVTVTDNIETLNQDFINQLSANSQIYLDKSGNYTITPATNSDSEKVEAPTNLPDDSEIGYPTIYISYDELQSVNSNLYNTLLSQSKLDNNDPLLMSTINESQDSNILFMDPTLGQPSDFQQDSQNFETFNQTMFSTSIAVNDVNLNSSNISLPLTNGSPPNLNVQIDESEPPSLSSMNEMSKPNQIKLNFNDGLLQNNRLLLKTGGVDSTKLYLSTDNITINDNFIITLSNDDLKTNDLNYFPSINFNLDNQSGLPGDVDNINLNIGALNSAVADDVQSNLLCPVCKVVFSKVDDIQKHQCIGLNPFSEVVANEDGSESTFIEITNEDRAVTDFEDQIDVTHIEISTEESAMHVEDSANHANSEDVAEHKCAECQKTFDARSKLLKHMVTHKNKKAENNCEHCYRSFKKPSDLKRHIRTHTGEKPFTCDRCNKSFSLKSTLQSHLRTHNPAGSKQFTCCVCNINYSCKASLRTHMLIHTGARPYPCHLCTAKFRTAAHRKSHVANHLKKTGKPSEASNKRANPVKVIGSYVDSIFSQPADEQKLDDTIIDSGMPAEDDVSHPSSSTAHANVMFQGEAGQNRLAEPVEGLPISDSIQIDILQQLQNSGLLLEDGAVDVLTSSLIQLDKQALQEKDLAMDKPDQDIIDVLNTDDDALVNNLLLNGDRSKSKDFKCETCHKMYTSRAILRKHQKIHREGFKCLQCDKYFHSEDLCNKHQKLHLGYRPYSCLLCANSFSEEGSLKTHMRRIHNAVVS